MDTWKSACTQSRCDRVALRNTAYQKLQIWDHQNKVRMSSLLYMRNRETFDRVAGRGLDITDLDQCWKGVCQQAFARQRIQNCRPAQSYLCLTWSDWLIHSLTWLKGRWPVRDSVLWGGSPIRRKSVGWPTFWKFAWRIWASHLNISCLHNFSSVHCSTYYFTIDSSAQCTFPFQRHQCNALV